MINHIKTEEGPYACNCGKKAELTVFMGCGDKYSDLGEICFIGCIECFEMWQDFPENKRLNEYLDENIKTKFFWKLIDKLFS